MAEPTEDDLVDFLHATTKQRGRMPISWWVNPRASRVPRKVFLPSKYRALWLKACAEYDAQQQKGA